MGPFATLFKYQPNGFLTQFQTENLPSPLPNITPQLGNVEYIYKLGVHFRNFNVLSRLSIGNIKWPGITTFQRSMSQHFNHFSTGLANNIRHTATYCNRVTCATCCAAVVSKNVARCWVKYWGQCVTCFSEAYLWTVWSCQYI